MKSKAMYPVVAVVGVACLSAAAWWYQRKPAAPQEAMGSGAATSAAARPASGAAPGGARVAGVEVARVEKMELSDDAQSVGSLRSRQSVMVRPEVAGRVQTLGFADGARVRKGQVLVQLDDTLQRAELAQAKAQAAIAQANFKRNTELVAQKFVAQRVLDESEAAMQVAQAQVDLAQARLARMAILAPFDGIVGLRVVNVGDYVKDGADLVNLEDTSGMLVDFRLPERFLQKLKVGQEVSLTLEAFGARTFAARVQALDPLLDANGRSVSVRALLPNGASDPAAGALRAGMFARVSTLFGVNPQALVVPEEAIVPQAGKQFVYLVVPPSEVPAATDLPPDTKTVSQRKEVQLGVRRKGKVEIVSGLSEGQTVVVAGQQRLQRDGTPLRVVDLNRPAQVASGAARGSSAAGGAVGGASTAASAASGASAAR